MSRRNKLAKPPEGDQSKKIYKGEESTEFPDWVQVKKKNTTGITLKANQTVLTARRGSLSDYSLQCLRKKAITIHVLGEGEINSSMADI